LPEVFFISEYKYVRFESIGWRFNESDQRLIVGGKSIWKNATK